MFQFTTTNVINSNKDLTTGKPLWSAQEASGEKPASFHVKRVNNFIATNVTAIYKAEAQDAEFAKVTMDFSQVNGVEGEIFRLHIYVGLSQASQSSLYANDLQWKGKPLSVDFVWQDSAANTVAKLIKTIHKYEMMVYGKKLLNVSYNGTCLTIEATDEYQRFRFVNVEKFDGDVYHGMGEYKVVRSLEDLKVKNSNAEVTSAAEGYFAGKEGFGTYSFLLHNLRIPTHDRTRYLALNQDETPIIGAKYNQYTIYYCVNRGILGTNAVGDVVKSRTTHVFYVNQTIAAEFEAALAKVGTVITVDGPGSANPDTVQSDLEALAKEVNTLKTQMSAKADKTEIADMQTKTEASSTYATKEELANKADSSALEGKQDALTAGDGIDLADNTVKVKLDGASLTVSAAGLKVTE